MASDQEAPVTAHDDGKTDRQHLIRIGTIWVVLSLIGMALVYFVWGPHLPPGTDSEQALNQQTDNKILATISVPVFIFIWTYLVYVLVNWRVKADTPVDQLQDGPAIRGNMKFQATWLVSTTVTVLALAVFGTYELINGYGSGTGSGPAPIWTPAGYSVNAAKSKLLIVQVIGQQWRFTYRYPQFGGVETAELALPVGQEVQFDVTSLDVIHNFWAENLGIKADANPGVNNIAFGKAVRTGSINVHCDELCGLWHGAMYDTGQVMTVDNFRTFMGGLLADHQDLLPYLPPFANIYLPQADGGYYNPSTNPLPNPPGPTPSPSPSVIS